MQTVRHFTRLSQLNFSIDTHFYPLGSCTMKYNPRACNKLAMLPPFLARHRLAPESHSQGFLACMHDLQEILKHVTGMAAGSLTTMAGAQRSDARGGRQEWVRRGRCWGQRCQKQKKKTRKKQ